MLEYCGIVVVGPVYPDGRALNALRGSRWSVGCVMLLRWIPHAWRHESTPKAMLFGILSSMSAIWTTPRPKLEVLARDAQLSRASFLRVLPHRLCIPQYNLLHLGTYQIDRIRRSS